MSYATTQDFGTATIEFNQHGRDEVVRIYIDKILIEDSTGIAVSHDHYKLTGAAYQAAERKFLRELIVDAAVRSVEFLAESTDEDEIQAAAPAAIASAKWLASQAS